MASNRGVAYIKPGEVQVQSIDFPKLADATNGKKIEHGVILKIISTNICGSDQHMVRGRTTAPSGLILGHEITGEVIETGRDVLIHQERRHRFRSLQHRLRPLPELQGRQRTGICLNVNPSRPGAAYGYVDMGGWVGGQAEYVMVPYADFNLLKFPDSDQAMAKIKDLTLLSDILPTGFHGAVTAGVGTGSTVYVAGPAPVGLACAAACHLLGAAVVLVGDMNPRAAYAGRQLRLRNHRSHQRRHTGRANRADRRRARGRLCRRLRGLRGPRPGQRGRARNARPPCSTRSWRSLAPAVRWASPAFT